MRKVLIIGVNGMLGHTLADVASKKFEVVGTCPKLMYRKKSVEIEKLDITDNNAVKSLVLKHNPNLIVNCAAVTNVDFCEDHPEIAYRVHVNGTKFLSNAADKIGAKFVHISTDFVFDGNKGNYTEDDVPRPINVYGKTKYEGEKVVSNSALVLRTCIYGWNVLPKKSIVEWIIDEIKRTKSINLFNDSYFTPIYTCTFSKIILQMSKKNSTGLYHVAGSKKISKYDFALEVAEVFNLNKNLIKPISFKSVAKKAKRPRDTSLLCHKLKKEGFRLENVKKGLGAMKNDKI
jgi:dTDP-4-dehydrorhamnose reductase